MADSKRPRRRGFLTWEPGAGDPHDGRAGGGEGTGRDGAQDGPSTGDTRDAGNGALTTDGAGRASRQAVATASRGEARARGHGPATGSGLHEAGADYASDDRDADGVSPEWNRSRGDGRRPGAAGGTEPGRTMVETHHSSAPPDLGPVRTSLDENKAILDAIMGVGTSFDIIFRELRFGPIRLAIYVVNGLFEAIDNLVLLKMADGLTALAKDSERLSREELGSEALRVMFETSLAYSQVTKTKSLSDAAFQVMSGPLAILVDGADEAIVVDIREYPDRLPAEPTTERVIRGPHDGFIETLVFNTALIRRRIRDPRLHFAITQAGVRSQIDVAIGYMDGLTDPSLVQEVTRRIKSIGVDAVPMAERTVAEYLTRQSWNPFPTTRMTERPDVAAFHLLEGHVVVLVDTSPQAIICPATFWNHVQHPEDYHLSPVMGTYMRWVQFIGLLFATLVPPLWLAIAIDPRIVHALPGLAFIGPKKPSGFPLGLQFLGAEVTLDLLRRAILNTPGNLSATMGILGAIVLGDVAAKTGIFSSEVLVYLVLAAIGQFAVSNIELGMAGRIVRLTLLIAVWALRLPGLLIGSLIWLLVLLGTRSFGIPYTWPLIPFSWQAFRGMLIREPVPMRTPRPVVLRTQDRSRQ